MFLRKLSALLFVFTVTTLFVFAQKQNNYTKNWSKINSLEEKGLIKSALQEATSIYKKAVKDNNQVQQIKACIYQIRYYNILNEESKTNTIFYLDTLIAKAAVPAKNILQSIQAEMYWHYLQNNRWAIYRRIKIQNEDSKDISTWSIDKLDKTIASLYKASLSNDSILKSTKIETYDSIIIKGENTRQLRPTLYDLLTHLAIAYFKTGEYSLTKPANLFVINDSRAFAQVGDFVNTVFQTSDTNSLQYTALVLFQHILKFHEKDADQNALIDADLLRLDFVSQYATNENRLALYENALENIEEEYANNPATAQAIYLRALMHYGYGRDYNALIDTKNQYETKKAVSLCKIAIKQFPKSEGAINAQNLLNQIVQPSLSLQTEQVNIPGQAFRTFVSYKNIKTIYLRVVKITSDMGKIDTMQYQAQWEAIAALPLTKEWSTNLPNLQDYQEHSTEIKIDSLPIGAYYLLASLDQNFSLQKNIITKQIIHVSNISYVKNNNTDYYVLNRDNGKPLPGTTVQSWNSFYNYKKSKWEWNKSDNYVTDQNGYFKLKPNDPTNYNLFVFLKFTKDNDELYLNENDYRSSYTYQQPIVPATFLFTDRSIYRPGQTIYFKGIIVKKDSLTLKSEILPGYKTKIVLNDASYQRIGELEITTNEYGSYHGSFTLPQGSLNGQFSLRDTLSGTTEYFNVEEYKRPTYTVTIKQPEGTYRLNDSIKVTGIAKAYSGSNIDGASIKYRVVRRVKYYNWNKYLSQNNSQTEIAVGNLTTNNKGEFVITFKALPDESLDKKDQPVFYYEINADVTDINGENQTGIISVAVSYQALQLAINTADKFTAEKLKDIIIRSSNNNGIEERTISTLLIEKLKSPDKIFRKRSWPQPDLFTMSKDEYYKDFPYDVYKNENEVSNYEIDRKVIESSDSTNSISAKYRKQIQEANITDGWYKIIASAKDKYGEEVVCEKYIQIINDHSVYSDPISILAKKNVVEPGEKIHYTIKTGYNNIWLIQTISKMNKLDSTSFQPIASSKSTINEINVTEADRGGINMNYIFVQHNCIYTINQNFIIPFTDKDLKISYETFRDKLLPGSEERWKLKITGNKGEKVTAEVLAAMYDESLDKFRLHDWNFLDLWPGLKSSVNWNQSDFINVSSSDHTTINYNNQELPGKKYDELLSIYSPLNSNYSYGMERRRDVVGSISSSGQITIRGVASFQHDMNPDIRWNDNGSFSSNDYGRHMKLSKGAFGDADGDGVSDDLDREPNTPPGNKVDSHGVTITNDNNTPVQIRKNFNETAFFFPDLQTDKDGNVSFSFTMPEALTKWKLMTFAHTKELATGYSEKTVITQKVLMVQPNAPRFIRDGDHIIFSAKVVNLSDSQLSVNARLELIDAITNTPVNILFKNRQSTQAFTVGAGQSTAISFPIDIPADFNSALTYRIIAQAGNYSDGEETAIPILSNKILVTESMPLNLRNTNKSNFKFEKLLNSGGSSTLSNHALTVEYTSNPAWYAIQSLPYLIEYPYECAEQTFNRYYANTLATYLTNSTPKIKAVFDKWRTFDTAALQSNLQKNEELKSALLQETPWVLDAQNESQQKKNIALLFDMAKMSAAKNKAIDKLRDMQSSNGGFVWFKGGQDDRYITQYIITGIGHLKKLNALSPADYAPIKSIVDTAIAYLDNKINEEYNSLIKNKIKQSDNNLSYTAIQYLYMRSFFPDHKTSNTTQIAFAYYIKQARQYWLSNNKYMQAMIALSLYRTGDEKTAKEIILSLKENSINNNELGMYWKDLSTGGYYWYQAPIESQAMMIEAFTDIDKNATTIDDLKTWLLKQKQTNNWKTTKATAEACYALLLNGNNWLNTETQVTIKLGDTIVNNSDGPIESGTGYFKKTIQGKDIKPAMGNIIVTIAPLNNNTSSATSWGSIYWQYFEDLNKITPAETPLKLSKQLFIQKNTDNGQQLIPINDNNKLKVGDKVTVRIILKVDRDMEYVQMKDMRAACMEPVNVLSGYQWQNGLGYYESTKDASTSFFFNQLPKGNYVFEYQLFVNNAGSFSNGITTIQCMYAPEFSSHSEGIIINVQNQ